MDPMRVLCLTLLGSLMVAATATAQDAPDEPIARIGTTRYHLAHPRRWQQPLLSADGKHLAISILGKGLEIWKLPQWTDRRFIPVDDLNPCGRIVVESMCFSPDGKRLLFYDAGSEEIFVWDLAAAKVVQRIAPGLRGPLYDSTLLLASDENTLIFSWESGPEQRSVLVWDVAKNRQRRVVRLAVTAKEKLPLLALSLDGRWLVLNKAPLELWDLTTGSTRRRIEAWQPMRQMVFSPDGSTLATIDQHGSPLLFDLTTGERASSPGKEVRGHRITFDPTGDTFFLAQDDHRVTRWRTTDCKPQGSHACPVDCAVSSFAFPAGGKPIAVGVSGDTVFCWEIETGKLLSPTDVPTGQVRALGFSERGELFVAAENGHAAWWDPRRAVKLRDVTFPAAPTLHHRSAGPIRLAGSARYLAHGDRPGFFDTSTGRPLDLAPKIDLPGRWRFYEDGEKVVALKENKLCRFDTRTAADRGKLGTPVLFDPSIMHLSVSRDGTLFAFRSLSVLGSWGLILWDGERGRYVFDRPSKFEGEAMDFSPDNRWFASAEENGALLLARLRGIGCDDYLIPSPDECPITSLAFAKDGRQLAFATGTARDPGSIYLVETISQGICRKVAGHPRGPVEHLAWSADSGILVSGASDVPVLVWEVGLRSFAQTPQQLSAKELEASFVQMGQDARSAFEAMIRLARANDQAVKLLRQRIPPAPRLNPNERTMAAWIEDLMSNQFVVRQRAASVIEKLGPKAIPNLRAALPKARDLEGKRRIEDLLRRIDTRRIPPEDILHTRAVEVIEAIASTEAREVLASWASGEPTAVLTEEAHGALRRLR
jgi:WD40 repeat protein